MPVSFERLLDEFFPTLDILLKAEVEKFSVAEERVDLDLALGRIIELALLPTTDLEALVLAAVFSEGSTDAR